MIRNQHKFIDRAIGKAGLAGYRRGPDGVFEALDHLGAVRARATTTTTFLQAIRDLYPEDRRKFSTRGRLRSLRAAMSTQSIADVSATEKAMPTKTKNRRPAPVQTLTLRAIRLNGDREALRAALAAHQGNLAAAARSLEISIRLAQYIVSRAKDDGIDLTSPS